MENLSEFYIQKAKVELREDENRKEQSIKQFQEWLSKHPFIIKCEMETFQIVNYLRARKYNMDKVYESFTKSVSLLKMSPELFYIHNVDHLLELYDKGPFLVMKNRDMDGRKIQIIRHKILEDSKFESKDNFKLNNLVNSTMLNEPETQIAGVVFIHDVRDISINYLSISDLNILVKFVPFLNLMPIRLKQINIVGLPAIANAAFELIKSFMSEKLSKRINLCRNVEDLGKVMDVKNLTIEYGGTEDAEDCLRSYRKNFEEIALVSINFFDKLLVDEEKMRNYENEKNFEGVGSFRKLEID